MFVITLRFQRGFISVRPRNTLFQWHIFTYGQDLCYGIRLSYDLEVSFNSLTPKSRVRFKGTLSGIWSGQINTGRWFSTLPSAKHNEHPYLAENLYRPENPNFPSACVKRNFHAKGKISVPCRTVIGMFHCIYLSIRKSASSLAMNSPRRIVVHFRLTRIELGTPSQTAIKISRHFV